MKVAYLAPELPALSATFVYNEILQLQTMGVDVVPFSVHLPVTKFQQMEVQTLKEKVQCLYGRSKLSVLKDNLYFVFNQPKRYWQALKLLLVDSWQIGLFSRTTIGLVYRFLFAGSLARSLTEQQCLHLHVHFAHIPSDIAMYASSISGIPFSVTAHANDLFERGWLLPEKVTRSKFFATISEFNKQYLIDLGADEIKIKIIRCGVDFEQFSARQNFQTTEKIKLGLVGRLVEKKGVDVLLKALRILKDKQIPVELCIAGSGPLQQELSQLTEKLSLSASDVQFLGVLPHKEVATFINSLDIFVLPCKKDKNGDMDGIPVVLMEAMLSGVPVISTKLSGIPELVINNETGLSAEPDNVASLVSAIKRMIDNSVLREDMVAKAIDKVKSDFALASNTKKLNELFNS